MSTEETPKIDLSSTLFPNERAALVAAGKDPTDYAALDLQAKPVQLAMNPDTGLVVITLEAQAPPGVFEGFNRSLLLGPDGRPQTPDLGRHIALMPQARFVVDTKALTSAAKNAALQSIQIQRGGLPKTEG